MGDHAAALAAADLDEDGALDLAVLAGKKLIIYQSDSAAWDRGDGEKTEIALPGRGVALAAGDGTGDGHADVVIAGSEPVVYLLAGSGSWDLPERPLSFQIRSAEKAAELGSQPWKDISSGAFSPRATDRSLQYRAILKSGNGDSYPVIDRVTVTLQD